MVKKLTNDDIVERIYSLVGDEYTKLDDVYVNSRTKFKIKHNVCGHEYEVNWSNFQSGKRCPKCSGNYRYADSEITEMISDMTQGEYTKLSIYIDSSTKFSIRHNTCGHEYGITWNTFQNGKRCPKCSWNAKLTNEEIVQKIHELIGDEYSKLNDVYEGTHIKFPIRHNTCRHEYEIAWNTFQSGVRCPKCNQSKGERFISDYLTNKSISFITQVRFDDCRSNRVLPFDFGIVGDENMIIALIEFDGKQHFEPSRFRTNVTQEQAEENLKQIQLRDQIKNKYCKNNNIPLLRIRYDEDIEEKLTTFLKEQNIIEGE